MTIRLDLTGRAAASASRQNGSPTAPKEPPEPRHGQAGRGSPFRRVQIRPVHKAGRARKSPRAGAPSGNADSAPPPGLGAKLYFVLFVSMCVFGAAVAVDTGPFPLNFIFGALMVTLPLALFIKGRRSAANAKNNDAVGRVS